MQKHGVGFRDPADGAKRGVHLLGLDQKTIDAGDSYSQRSGPVDGGHEFVVDAAGKDLEHGVQGFGCGDAETSDESAGDAAFGEVAGHLFAAAVDHGDFMPGVADGRDLACQAIARVHGIEQRSAEFDQQFHNSPSVSA